MVEFNEQIIKTKYEKVETKIETKMKTKRTLDKTWDLCLQMWLDISQKWAIDFSLSIGKLKYQWLKENGFENEYIFCNCFFCNFDDIINNDDDDCRYCPGKLIDNNFSCLNDNYRYDRDPIVFYEELLRLNKIRLKYDKTR